MSDDRKTPLWPWLVALLIGLPVLYIASIGPACWICAHTDSGKHVVGTIYSPMIALFWHDSSSLRRVVRWYATIGCGSRELVLPAPGGQGRLHLNRIALL
jgi:hypothetical protein